MPINDVFTGLSGAGTSLYIVLIVIPVGVFVVSWIHGVYDGRRAPWRYVYGLAVHLTTAAIVALGALVVLHVLDGGTLERGLLSRSVVAYIAGCWVLTLLVVKRAVDFNHIPTVRNPLLLVVGWAAGWTAGGVLYRSGLWLIPGPAVYTVLVAALVVFSIFEMIIMLLGSRR